MEGKINLSQPDKGKETLFSVMKYACKMILLA